MTSPERKTPLHVLVLADDPAEIQLIRVALTDSQLSYELITLSDAPTAVAYLRRQTPYEQAPQPDLIFVDLDLPNQGGQTVLAVLHADPALRRIRVLVLSSSRHVKTVLRRYHVPVTSLIVKSPRQDYAARVRQALEEFWETLLALFEDAGSRSEENGNDCGHES